MPSGESGRGPSRARQRPQPLRSREPTGGPRRARCSESPNQTGAPLRPRIGVPPGSSVRSGATTTRGPPTGRRRTWGRAIGGWRTRAPGPAESYRRRGASCIVSSPPKKNLWPDLNPGEGTGETGRILRTWPPAVSTSARGRKQEPVASLYSLGETREMGDGRPRGGAHVAHLPAKGDSDSTRT